MGVVAVFLDPKDMAAQVDGESGILKYPIKTIILDFIKLTKSHTGEYLAEKLLACLKFFGIELKVCLRRLHPAPDIYSGNTVRPSFLQWTMRPTMMHLSGTLQPMHPPGPW